MNSQLKTQTDPSGVLTETIVHAYSDLPLRIIWMTRTGKVLQNCVHHYEAIPTESPSRPRLMLEVGVEGHFFHKHHETHQCGLAGCVAFDESIHLPGTMGTYTVGRKP